MENEGLSRRLSSSFRRNSAHFVLGEAAAPHDQPPLPRPSRGSLSACLAPGRGGQGPGAGPGPPRRSQSSGQVRCGFAGYLYAVVYLVSIRCAEVRAGAGTLNVSWSGFYLPPGPGPGPAGPTPRSCDGGVSIPPGEGVGPSFMALTGASRQEALARSLASGAAGDWLCQGYARARRGPWRGRGVESEEGAARADGRFVTAPIPLMLNKFGVSQLLPRTPSLVACCRCRPSAGRGCGLRGPCRKSDRPRRRAAVPLAPID